jgi:hypothetical protein
LVELVHVTCYLRVSSLHARPGKRTGQKPRRR